MTLGDVLGQISLSTKANTILSHLHEVLRVIIFIDTERDITGGEGRMRMRSYCLMDAELFFRKMKTSESSSGYTAL
jgi:hypothetical protein